MSTKYYVIDTQLIEICGDLGSKFAKLLIALHTINYSICNATAKRAIRTPSQKIQYSTLGSESLINYIIVNRSKGKPESKLSTYFKICRQLTSSKQNILK